MTIATEFQALASELVGEFASEATLRRVTQSEGSYDPVEGGYTGGGEVVTDETIEITPPKGFNQYLIDGTQIQIDDLRTVVAAIDMPFVPDVADPDSTYTVVYNGTEYSLINLWRGSVPDNLEASYVLQLRG